MYKTKEYPPEDETAVKETVYSDATLKQISKWHLGVTSGFALGALMFASRTGGMVTGLIWAASMFAALFFIFKLKVFKEIFASLADMPQVMKQIWWVKLFTWYGLPLMWQYLSLATAKYAFNAASPTANPAGFEAGKNWGSLCFAMFSIACFVISIFIPAIVKKLGSRRMTHAIFLTIGAIGFFIMILSDSKWIYFAGMTLMGFAWGSIVAIPYLMIADAVSPARMGVYMGLINAFICVPQFIGMLTVPLFYKTILGDDPRNALLLCGLCLFLAAIACFWVKEDVQAYSEPVAT